jgi:hypothetical protein
MRSAAWSRSLVLVAVAVGAALSLASPASAQSAEAARKKVTGYYQMPFPCGQQWTGSTRAGHSPSSYSIDWNRPDDDGDDIVASAPGTVTTANKTGRTGYGRWVRVTHAGGETTVYAHLSSVAVSVGQVVDQGQLLGQLGSTGNSTGPHLHYEQALGTQTLPAAFEGVAFKYGSTVVSKNCVDVPLAADMVGTAEAELVVFRRGVTSTFQVQRPGLAPLVITFGRSTDQPVLGDWDGDGRANAGVRRPEEGTFYLSTPGGTIAVGYGIPSDRPIAGDWNGDGRTDVGVHRSSEGVFYLRNPDGTSQAIALGDKDDLPVTGDWNGDGVTDLGVYDSATATFQLRYVGASGVAWLAPVVFGVAGDLPVVGDWNGDGGTDLGIWRAASATFVNRTAASTGTGSATVTQVRFGRPRATR